ncbi:FecR domain-containing protein [Bauldia sp.]|uniref:FecR domain-containing protein n=1 Tax=Bauldia sp. TaxID=2575872 RepID=UPI003BAB4FBE
MRRVLRRLGGGVLLARCIRRQALAAVCAALLAATGATYSTAQDGAYLTVTIGDDETIRQVADKYLSDPDLWPEILRSSGVESIADLRPGMQLLIPVSEITAANQALISALGQIQRANRAGAQIFAPDEIGRAVDLHEQALEQRLARRWVATRDLAEASYGEATNAIEVSEAKRDQAAEALVTDRSGEVEGQRPADLSWRDLQLRAILVEEEKVRTLSDSTAQITFRDASRVRLNENSNAIIRQMRFDPLTRTEAAKVSLVEGDFYALLSGDGDAASRSRFDVEIPNVDAVIDSGNFWVSNSGDSAKFTNYDERIVAVAAAGETVTLGKNEGTIVDAGQTPRDKLAVLPPPAQIGPDDGATVYVATPELSWAPGNGAAGYWLEIAADQNFDRIVENAFGVVGPTHTTDRLGIGEYFWRVSALDGFGLPGARSPAFAFRVAPDDTPPFLSIETPPPDVIIRDASVTVSGESEPDALVTVNGAPVAIADDGGFVTTVIVRPGDNTIAIAAIDPAGNETQDTRSIVFMPDRDSVIAFDPAIRRLAPDRFLASGDVLSLSGTTTANSEIDVRTGDAILAAAASDSAGVFEINVPLAADDTRFDIVVTAPSGFATTEPFAATIDRQAPEIAFTQFPPRLTAEAEIRLTGETDPEATVTLNGTPLATVDGRFDETVPLSPGSNPIELIATDRAGNVQVDRSVVTFDNEPPQLVSAEGAPVESGGQPALALSVEAEDATGLAKAAPFVVTAGDQTLTGYLRYNRAAGRYQAVVVVPAGDGTARLARVELQDDAGNRRVYDIP